VWGKPPLPSGSSLRPAATAALRREAALASARRRGERVYRVAPPNLRPGRFRNAARAALLGGAIVTPRDKLRLIDIAGSKAGAVGLHSLRPSAAGGVLAVVALVSGGDSLMRVGVRGEAGDPHRAARALESLAGSSPNIPRLLGYGEADRASWTLESLCTGSRPRRLTRRLAQDLREFCARLPRPGGAPSAPTDDLLSLAELLPDRAGALSALADDLAGRLEHLEAIGRHGDLWLGNTLARRGRLTGVIDWDAWHPSGVPAADLLHLYATDLRIRSRRELGEVWLERPWRDDDFVTFIAPYGAATGARLGESELDVGAVAWWASEMAGTLSRVPHRALDEAWVAINIDAVCARLARG